MQQLSLFSNQDANELANLPSSDANRIVAHIDMDAFFASVELLHYPQIKHLPVVIGGSRQQLDAAQLAALARLPLSFFTKLQDYTGRGVITTANYHARQFGVGSAMGLMKAAKLCPQAILLPSQFTLYRQYSQQFKQIILQHAKALEDRGIDEVFVELTQLATVQKNGVKKWAQLLKEEILNATGLTCSIGIAPNKLLAKMASEFNKPNGISLVSLAEIKTKIWPLACKKINGIGPKANLKLQQSSINTIGQLASCNLSWLIDNFGQNYGYWLYCAARGIDNNAVCNRQEPSSISRETTFTQDMHVKNDRKHLTQAFIQLCQQLSLDLQRKGFVAKAVAIKIKFADFKTVTRVCSVEYTVGDANSIAKLARLCLKRVDFYGKLRLLGVRLSNLQKHNLLNQISITENGDDNLFDEADKLV